MWDNKLGNDTFMDLHFRDQLATPCSLDAFKALQRKYTKDLVDRLNNEWRKNVVNFMVDNLHGVVPSQAAATGPSAFVSAVASVSSLASSTKRSIASGAADEASGYNFYTNDIDAHLASPLHRLIRTAEMLMASQVCRMRI